MDNLYIENLKVIWDYTHLNQTLEKSDLIIGCGCGNLQIPVKCAKLLKDGYAPKILFCGGLGKITKDIFNKSESEVYKDIAIKEGINEKDILIENKSTNTGDNFRFSLKILEKNNIKANKIIIVHGPFSERRTLYTAKTILKDKQITITSPDMSFEEFLDYLEKNKHKENEIISVIVSDIQKMIVYPQFGWQLETEVPNNVLEAYNFFKNLGFDEYILTKKKIDDLVVKNGLVKQKKINYFS